MNIQRMLGEYNGRKIDIPLNGRDLIVTGVNGAGKTFFLTEINVRCKEKIELYLEDLFDVRRTISTLAASAQSATHPHQVESNEREIQTLEERAATYSKKVNIEIDNVTAFRELYHKKKGAMLFFHAGRTTSINPSTGAKGLEVVKEAFQNSSPDMPLRDTLEEHLVNLKTRRALALTEEHDQALADSIERWFEEFEENLCDLMEDKSARLIFNSKRHSFSITREKFPPTDFQNLSSGHSAIFSIFSELLMRTAYYDILPTEMRGIIIIDEIDAHLHVSLQRLILPFLKRSFPNIQFIVSTHSPFILTSIENAVIYDMGENEIVDENITFFSYAAVMEGLLGTPPISVALEKAMDELSNEAAKANPSHEKLERLIIRIEPSERMLDVVSRTYYEVARSKLIDMEND